MGPSGVGKKTFLQRLDSNGEFRASFGLSDDLVTYGPGFQGQHEAFTSADVLAQATSNSVAIKWQAASDKELEALQRLRPHAEHHMVLLQLPAEEHHRDLLARNPESKETEERIAAFAANTLSACIDRTSRGFRLTVIDASGGEYRRADP